MDRTRHDGHQWLLGCVPRSRRARLSGHLQLHLQQQVHAHAHGSSKPSVTAVFSVCFPRQQKTTDLPWARMTCCAGRHIWPHAWSSSMILSNCILRMYFYRPTRLYQWMASFSIKSTQIILFRHLRLIPNMLLFTIESSGVYIHNVV